MNEEKTNFIGCINVWFTFGVTASDSAGCNDEW